MRERGTVASFAAWESGKERFDAAPELNRQTGDGSELDDDGIHLPVRISKNSGAG